MAPDLDHRDGAALDALAADSLMARSVRCAPATGYAGQVCCRPKALVVATAFAAVLIGVVVTGALREGPKRARTANVEGSAAVERRPGAGCVFAYDAGDFFNVGTIICLGGERACSMVRTTPKREPVCHKHGGRSCGPAPGLRTASSSERRRR